MIEKLLNGIKISFTFYLKIVCVVGCAGLGCYVGFSLVAVSRGYSSLRCTGFWSRWLLLLRSLGSRHVGVSSCGAWTLLPCDMWDLPSPGIIPVFPALAGRFLTTGPTREVPKRPLREPVTHQKSWIWQSITAREKNNLSYVYIL